ncbi:MAG: 50S ribosomal protein L11 methyltransferase [bacterium]
MPWYVVEFPLEEELCEVAAETLREGGADGASAEWRVRDGWHVRGFWKDAHAEEVTAETDTTLAKLAEFGIIPEVPAYVLSSMEDQDWLEGWKQFFSPFEVSPRLAVVPSWEEFTPQPGQQIITLDPGMAFGTGTHGTTFTCLQALSDYLQPGMRVADFGTGSGILAIAAVKLDAGSVTATDNDDLAVRVACENAAVNGVAEKIDFRVSDLEAGVDGPYDLVLANILAPVVLRLIPLLPRILAQKAIFISSGYITSQEADICSALEAAGHSVLTRYEREDWVTVVSKLVVS